MNEPPDTVHGRLMQTLDTNGRCKEGFHIASYVFERACSQLEWLLDEDRWKSCGGGFDSINDFLATLDFSNFRPAVEQRKKIAQKIKAISDTSGRATARMLGV